MSIKQFGINPDNRRIINDAKRRTGFTPEQVDYRDLNEGLFSIVQEHILGTSVQLSANDCTIKYDPSDNSFRDKNAAAVVFSEGDRITIIGLDMTENVDITTDKIIVRQDPTTEIDTSTFTLTFSGDNVDVRIFATNSANVLVTGSEPFAVINSVVKGLSISGDDNTITEVNSIKDQGGVFFSGLKCKVLEIGNWNMDTTIEVLIPHGLDYDDIISVTAFIKSDNDHYGNMINGTNITGQDFGGIAPGETNIVLQRANGGAFDNNGFDSTPYNRGYITIWYDAS